MHKKHNSHHIFLFLGLLILLFIFIFGIRHFASEYTYDKKDTEINNSQNYEDGLHTNNPFNTISEENREPGEQILTANDTDTDTENSDQELENL